MTLHVDLRLRPKRRRTERGAAVFVIVLVITMLTALGVWSVRQANLVDIAAGYSRQAAQAQYVSELGIHSTTAFLATGVADYAVKGAQDGIDTCTSNTGLTAVSPFCSRFVLSELNGAMDNPLLDTAALGSLGPAAVGTTGFVQGDFLVEMTDVGPAGAGSRGSGGMDLGGTNTSMTQARVTLTAMGQVRPIPFGIAANACNQAISSAAGRQMMRAHAVLSPISP